MNTFSSFLIVRSLGISLLLPIAAAFAAPGDRDTSFKSSVTWNMTFALQADGKIVVATYNPESGNPIVRLNSDGTRDGSFKHVTPTRTLQGAGSAAEVRAIAIQPDDKILIGGPFDKINRVARDRIARVEADGTLDVTFDPHLPSPGWLQAYAMAIRNDGKILAGGILQSVTDFVPAMVVLNSDGSIDHSFVAPARSVVALAVEPNGKIVFGGSWETDHGVLQSGIARLEEDGSLDVTFSGARIAGFNSHPSSIALQPDGKIIIGGIFDSVAGVSRRGIARINSDGSLDNSFDPGSGVNFERPEHGGSDGRSVSSVAVQRDGKILLAGTFEKVNGVSRVNIARLNADGSVDLAFQPPATLPRFGQLAFQRDGNLLAGNGTALVRLLTGEALPPLSIVRSGEEIILSWSTGAGPDAILERSDSMYPASWMAEPIAPAVVGERYVLPISSTARPRFYRLRSE